MEGIAMKPPTAPVLASSPPSSGGRKYVTFSSPSEGEIPSTLLLAIISGAVLLLYSLSRIMSLHRRVNDLEARPPVDDIVLRGIIRRQMNEMIEEVNQEKASETQKDFTKAPLLKKKGSSKVDPLPPASFLPESFLSKISSNIVDVTPHSPPSSPTFKGSKIPPDVIRVPFENQEQESDEEESVKSVVVEEVPLIKEEKEEQTYKTPPKKTKSKKAPAPERKLKKRGLKSQNEDEYDSALNV